MVSLTCNLFDCLTPILITTIITTIAVIVINIYLYFRLVRIAREKLETR